MSDRFRVTIYHRNGLRILVNFGGSLFRLFKYICTKMKRTQEHLHTALADSTQHNQVVKTAAKD